MLAKHCFEKLVMAARKRWSKKVTERSNALDEAARTNFAGYMEDRRERDGGKSE